MTTVSDDDDPPSEKGPTPTGYPPVKVQSEKSSETKSREYIEGIQYIITWTVGLDRNSKESEPSVYCFVVPSLHALLKTGGS